MERHLSDAELLDALSGEGAAAEHLRECAGCRADCEDLARHTSALRAWTLAHAGQSPDFWRAQRAAIAARIKARTPASLRWALAGSLALLAIASALFHASAPPPSVPGRAQADPDHLLMLEVERSLRSDVPRALEPAQLIAQEITRSQNRRSN